VLRPGELEAKVTQYAPIMTSPRPPLDVAALARAVRPPWTRIDVADLTQSTNADLIGAPAGSVLLAEHQTAGRGRLDRTWVAPARSSVIMSVALRPLTPPSTWGWLSLLTGVAVCDVAGSAAVLKWPNDVLLGPNRRKTAGILVQAQGESVVIGVGLNVSTTRDELPVDTATSLAIEGLPQDRTQLTIAILDALGSRFLRWQEAGGDAEESGLLPEYVALCSTIGQEVTVTGTDGSARAGQAVGIDRGGRLRLVVDGVEQIVAAGDVHHVRPIHGQ
jgi:BirA family transcriptional regulator, biotin operon repressor / biotin---[acetyl-CoA-carboxylase] ligase